VTRRSTARNDGENGSAFWWVSASEPSAPTTATGTANIMMNGGAVAVVERDHEQIDERDRKRSANVMPITVVADGCSLRPPTRRRLPCRSFSRVSFREPFWTFDERCAGRDVRPDGRRRFGG